MVRRRHRPLSFPARNAPIVMLVLPASSARSMALSDRPHATGKDFRHRSIILPEEQEAGRVESAGYAFEDDAILVNPDSAAMYVTGGESEGFTNRLRPALLEHAAGSVDGIYQGAKHLVARYRRTRHPQRSSQRRDLGRKAGVPHVNADAGDHGFSLHLRQDSGALLFAEQDIVGPA